MKNALLIIDMQNDFVLPQSPLCVAGAFATIPVIKTLLNRARQEAWKIFHVIRQHCRDGSDAELWRVPFFAEGPGICIPGTEGCRIVDSLSPLPDEQVIIKHRFSAFFHTDLDLRLRRLGIQNVIIAGTQYPNCIRGTAVDAMSLDYHTFIITDGCSAQSADIAAANIRDLQNMGITCVPAAELDSILERANV